MELPKRWPWFLYGLGWTVLLSIRLSVGGSSINFFTNWDALLHAVFFVLVPRPLDLVVGPAVTHIGGLVAILSTVIFIYGSDVFRDAIDDHGPLIVHPVNILIHIVPWFVSLFYAWAEIRPVVATQSPRIVRETLLWGLLLPSLLLPVAYMMHYDVQAKYGTTLSLTWIWIVSLSSLALSAGVLDALLRVRR